MKTKAEILRERKAQRAERMHWEAREAEAMLVAARVASSALQASIDDLEKSNFKRFTEWLKGRFAK